MREGKRQKGNKDDDHEVDDHQTVIMMRADGHETRRGSGWMPESQTRRSTLMIHTRSQEL
jgi:hypothetical protein